MEDIQDRIAETGCRWWDCEYCDIDESIAPCVISLPSVSLEDREV